MATGQSGITLTHCKAAIFMEAKVIESALLVEQCKALYQQFETLKMQYPAAMLGMTIAFSEKIWRQLAKASSAPELKAFPQYGAEKIVAPATQYDILIHIQSQRPDVNFSLALLATQLLKTSVQFEEEIHGFRWIEDRDLTGFIDGSENPEAGAKLESIALIADGEDKGGSYVLTQRYEHHLDKWHKLSTDKQEQVIGRTKADSVELDDVPAHSHVGRVDLKENGKGLKMMRQSLPYGTASGVHGLYFIGYSAWLYHIEKQLQSMFGELDGKTDRLLGFTKPVTGNYYFAPSVEQLLAL